MQTPTFNPYTVDELKQMLWHTGQPSESDNPNLLTPELFQHLITENSFTFSTLTNYHSLKYLLVSPMAEAVTGYTNDMFQSGGLRFMLSLVHPAKMATLQLIHQQMITFFNTLPDEEKTAYAFGYNVKIRKADNTYIQLLCQISCEQLSSHGTPLLGKEIFTDITPFNHQDDMKLIIRKKDKASDNQTRIYIFDTTPRRRELTAREKEINELVIQGLTSKKIAEILSLSKNTIDTYRRKIKRKN